MEETKKKKILTPLNILTAIFIVLAFLALSIPTLNTLKRIQLEEKYEKKIKEIKQKAHDWAEKNEITEPTIITVNKLAKEGMLESNGSKDVISPKDNRPLNCHTIYIEYKSKDYNVTYNEQEDCEFMNTEDMNIFLKGRTSSGKKLISGELTSEDVILNIESDTEMNDIIWFENGEEIVEHKFEETYLIQQSENYNKTISVKVVTNQGIKLVQFIVNIEKIPEVIE